MATSIQDADGNKFGSGGNSDGGGDPDDSEHPPLFAFDSLDIYESKVTVGEYRVKVENVRNTHPESQGTKLVVYLYTDLMGWGFFGEFGDHLVKTNIAILKVVEPDENGNIDPQQIDHAKLVPLLTAALKESIAKIEALEARVATLENN